MAQKDPWDGPGPRPSDRPVVVVLGATGFVGRHLHAAFSAAGARVLQVSRRAPAPSAPGPGGPGDPGPTDAAFLALDLLAAPQAELTRLFAGADAVVNAVGAVWGVTEARMGELNAELPRHILRALRPLARRPRLVHLGSVHEYGPVPPGEWITEDVPTEPVSPYGRTKLLGTQAVLEAARADEADAVVLRVANVSGPGAPPESLLGGVAHHLARAARTAGAPPALRLAPLRARRDFVDVRDVADAVVAAAGAPGVCGQVINIGSGQAVGVRELVDRLVELSGLAVAVAEEGPRTGGRGDLTWQRADVTRARELLG